MGRGGPLVQLRAVWPGYLGRGADHPLSVAPVLVEALFSKLQTVVSTSATLDLHDEFEFWAKRVGLPYTDERPFFKGTFASPFEYSTHLLLITPEDAPLPAKELEEEYLAYMSKTVLEATLASGGGALVLFTSYALLKELRSRLSEAYEEAGLLLLSQGELDRHTLLRTFVEERDSVLFATSSFWEGWMPRRHPSAGRDHQASLRRSIRPGL